MPDGKLFRQSRSYDQKRVSPFDRLFPPTSTVKATPNGGVMYLPHPSSPDTAPMFRPPAGSKWLGGGVAPPAFGGDSGIQRSPVNPNAPPPASPFQNNTTPVTTLMESTAHDGGALWANIYKGLYAKTNKEAGLQSAIAAMEAIRQKAIAAQQPAPRSPLEPTVYPDLPQMGLANSAAAAGQNAGQVASSPFAAPVQAGLQSAYGNRYDTRIAPSPEQMAQQADAVAALRKQMQASDGAFSSPGGADMYRRFGPNSPLSQPLPGPYTDAEAYKAAQARALGADRGSTASVMPEWDSTAGREKWLWLRQNQMETQNPLAYMGVAENRPLVGDSFVIRDDKTGNPVGTNRLGALMDALSRDPENKMLQGAVAQERGYNAERGLKRREEFAKNLANARARQSDPNSAFSRKMARKEQQKWERAVRNGMNPMSPQAEALFPQQVADLQRNRAQSRAEARMMMNQAAGGKGPTPSPFDQGKAPTPASRQQAKAVEGVMLAGTEDTPPSALLSAAGSTPEDMDINRVHTYVNTAMQNGTELDTGSVRDLRNYLLVLRQKEGVKENFYEPNAGNPEAGRVYGMAYQALMKLPDNATDDQLNNWYRDFKRAQWQASQVEKAQDSAQRQYGATAGAIGMGR